MYIHERPEWPRFTRRDDRLIAPLAKVRELHGRLLGRLDAVGLRTLSETTLENLTQDVVRSAEIEGDRLEPRQVRSSIARRLGLESVDVVPASREVDGMVALTLDAIRDSVAPMTRQRLLGWHDALFPNASNGFHEIRAGRWRDDRWGPMQVVSVGGGAERILFQAPEAVRIAPEMERFLDWLRTDDGEDPVLKAATAHLWLVTIHPFDDGNGRIARALTDMLLARMDGRGIRFYSLSAVILSEREDYYGVLGSAQGGTLDITEWLLWFLRSLEKALERAAGRIGMVLQRHLFWQHHRSAPFNGRHRKLLGILLEGREGRLTLGKWSRIARCPPDTASRDIQFLLDRGILECGGRGGRGVGYRLVA